MPTTDPHPSTSTAPAQTASVWPAALPIAAAIGVFGLIYGAAARPVIGPGMAIVSSVVIFSGAAQFTMIALLAAGAGPVGVVGGVAALALRHLPLGAVLRPRLETGRGRRALLSWFLIDETTGLALTHDGPVPRTLTVSGSLAYGAWVLGTLGGVVGASVASIEPLAAAVFPALFIGLTALTVRTRGDAGRAVIAGVSALVLLAAFRGAGALGAIAVAVVVAGTVRTP